MRNLDIIGAEVYAVLKQVPSDQYVKIPLEKRKIFEKYDEGAHKIEIDLDKDFSEQNISKQAKDIIFAISLNYWLTEAERQKVIRKLKENEKEWNNKYDVEKMFQKSPLEVPERKDANEIMIVNRKERFITRIINRIKKFFTK